MSLNILKYKGKTKNIRTGPLFYIVNANKLFITVEIMH